MPRRTPKTEYAFFKIANPVPGAAVAHGMTGEPAQAPDVGPTVPGRVWRWVLGFALVYGLVWTLAPPLLAPSLPLDVVESISWGHEWQWGYYKHPPLAPWLLYVFYRVFGRAGPFLLSQLCVGATVWLVWRTGRRLLTPERALVGAVLTMGVVYYTQPALEFNHNVAQMPVWAALGFLFLAALQDGRLRDWLALGAVAGLGLLTKYTVLILLTCLGLYLLLTSARRWLLRAGPWMALGVAALVVLPHLVWLWRSDWLPLSYAGARAVDVPGHDARASVAGFVLTQALNHLPLAVIVAGAWWRYRWSLRRTAAPAAGQRWQLAAQPAGYLLTIGLAPGALLVAIGLTLGIRLHDMWGAPMWAFSGLLVAAVLPTSALPHLRPRLLAGVTVWLLLATLLSGVLLAWSGAWRQRPARTDWPQQALAQHARASWAAVSSCPLATVAGDYWLAGLAALGRQDQASVLIAGDARFSPWITPQRLSDDGALWIWQGDESATPPAPLDVVAQKAGFQVHEGQWQLRWPRLPSVAPLLVHWRAYVPEACAPPAVGVSQRP